ncbi:MAG: ABC transporter permease [Bacillota bacterium]
MSRIITVQIAVKRTLAISKKNAKIYYMKSAVIIFGLLFPAVMFLAFTIGRDMEPAQLTPSILGVAVLFAASAVGPLISPMEHMMKTYERMLTAPISLWNITMGDIISGFLFGLLISMAPLLVGWLIFNTQFTYIIPLIIALCLAIFCFSALGSLVSAMPTDMPQNAMMLANLIRFPLIFISGVFIPLREMPTWAQSLAHISPLTYAVDLFRWSMGGSNSINIYFSYFMLIVFTIIFVCWCKAAQQKSIKILY